MSTSPLAGVTVVEVAGFVFVPIATAIMADLGADVIKIEPITGDQLRKGRPGTAEDQADSDGLALLVEYANRGKRSIALDLTSDGGRSILRRLAERADVFATSYLEHVRDRLEINVDHIMAVNPSIVYARGSGWGSAGPMRNDPAFDIVSGWAGSGVASMMADAHGEPPSMPIGIFDIQAGSQLAGAIAIALYRRAVSGEGSVVDTALLNAGMWAIQADISASSAGVDAGRTIRETPANALVNWYRTGDDRWIYLALVRSESEWVDLCRAMDRPDLAVDERFASATGRAAHSHHLAAELAAEFASRPLDAWRERFTDFRGCWGPMLTPDEILTHRQVLANGFVVDHERLGGTRVGLVAPPMHFDEAPTRPRAPAPSIGQHTAQVLAELGYDATTVDDLCVEGVCRRS